VDEAEQRQLVEGLIFASPEPVSAKRIANLIPDCDTRGVHAHVAALNESYEAEQRAFRVIKVAGGYQLRTVEALAPALRALRPTPPLRLSKAALETLAIVAYRQPITRSEVEHIRGVDAGPVMRNLLERELVRIAGHREVPGRPILYATTKRFLEVLGLNSLGDLPTLREIDELLTESKPESAPADGATDAAPSLVPPDLADEPAKLH
jgi:segregation and condensation protein B